MRDALKSSPATFASTYLLCPACVSDEDLDASTRLHQ